MKLLVVLIAVAMANMAVPAHPEGYTIQHLEQPEVMIDLYEDPLCSACAQFDVAFSRFLEREYDNRPIYSIAEITFHFFPLPYHRNAFIVSKLGPYIYEKEGGLAIHDYLSFCLQNESYFNSHARETTEAEFKEDLCMMAQMPSISRRTTAKMPSRTATMRL